MTLRPYMTTSKTKLLLYVSKICILTLTLGLVPGTFLPGIAIRLSSIGKDTNVIDDCVTKAESYYSDCLSLEPSMEIPDEIIRGDCQHDPCKSSHTAWYALQKQRTSMNSIANFGKSKSGICNAVSGLEGDLSCMTASCTSAMFLNVYLEGGLRRRRRCTATQRADSPAGDGRALRRGAAVHLGRPRVQLRLCQLRRRGLRGARTGAVFRKSGISKGEICPPHIKPKFLMLDLRTQRRSVLQYRTAARFRVCLEPSSCLAWEAPAL